MALMPRRKRRRWLSSTRAPEQKNEDTKEIETADDSAPEDFTFAGQLEFLAQANINLQAGFASADADLGEVNVQSLDTTSAGGDGIVASSDAFANAEIDQKARQKNDNELDATGTFVWQGQLLEQFNWNEQFGFATADATSDEVTVTQNGELDAGGTGISATSEATALADIDQEARQKNENELDADGPIVSQGQLVGQDNDNLQVCGRQCRGRVG